MDPVNEEFIDSIITNLKILGLLQINDKLNIRKGHLHIDKESGIQFVKRWFFRDSRDNTLLYIKDVIRNIYTLFSKIKIGNTSGQGIYNQDDINWIVTRVLTELEKSENGINNLKTTYSCDSMTSVVLENIIVKIRELCTQGRTLLVNQSINQSI